MKKRGGQKLFRKCTKHEIDESCDFLWLFLNTPSKALLSCRKMQKTPWKNVFIHAFFVICSDFFEILTSCYPAALFLLENYQISTESNVLGLKVCVINAATNLVRFRFNIFLPFLTKTLESGTFRLFSNIEKFHFQGCLSKMVTKCWSETLLDW